jgi:hypothetical protein
MRGQPWSACAVRVKTQNFGDHACPSPKPAETALQCAICGLLRTRSAPAANGIFNRGGGVWEVQIDTQELSDLSLSYSMHDNKGQGITAETSGILMGGWQPDKQHAYVAVSRAREQTQIYASRENLREMGLDVGANASGLTNPLTDPPHYQSLNKKRRGPAPLEEPAPVRLAALQLGWQGLTPRWPRSLRLGSASRSNIGGAHGRHNPSATTVPAFCGKSVANGRRSEMIRSMRPTTSTLLALAAIAMLLAGCGSSTHASSISAAVGADKPIASAQDRAYAHAVNLRAADIPGLVPVARHKEGAGTFLGRCEKPAGDGEAIGIPSQAFTQSLERKKGPGVLGVLSVYPEESVRSAVYTTTTSTRATRALSVAIGPVGQACLRRSFRGTTQVSSESGHEEPFFTQVKVFPLHIQIGPVQIQGMRASASLAAGMTNTPNRQPYYEDLLGFSSGPNEIFLKVTSSPSDPAATERRLLSLLYTRAETHKL